MNEMDPHLKFWGPIIIIIVLGIAFGMARNNAAANARKELQPVIEYAEYWQNEGTERIRSVIYELRLYEKTNNLEGLQLIMEADRLALQDILDEAPLPY